MTTLLDIGKSFINGTDPNSAPNYQFGQTTTDTYVRYGTVNNLTDDGITAYVQLDGNEELIEIKLQPKEYFSIGDRVEVAYKNGQILTKIASRESVDYSNVVGGGDNSGGSTFDPTDILKDIESLKSTTSTLNSWKESHTTEYSDLSSKLDSHIEDYNALEEKVNGLSPSEPFDPSDINASLSDLTSRTQTLEDWKTSHSSEYSNLLSKVNSLESTVNDLSSQGGGGSVDLSDIYNRLTNLETFKSALQSVVDISDNYYYKAELRAVMLYHSSNYTQYFSSSNQYTTNSFIKFNAITSMTNSGGASLSDNSLVISYDSTSAWLVWGSICISGHVASGTTIYYCLAAGSDANDTLQYINNPYPGDLQYGIMAGSTYSNGTFSPTISISPILIQGGYWVGMAVHATASISVDMNATWMCALKVR